MKDRVMTRQLGRPDVPVDLPGVIDGVDAEIALSEIALTPESRMLSEVIQGTSVDIGGMAWLLARHVPELGPVWGRLYDQNVLSQVYEPNDLRLAAVRLLMANYAVTIDEAVGMILLATGEELVHAVEFAMFGPEKTHYTWVDWVEGSFLINGLNLAKIPAEKRSLVLDMLVLSGRTVPASKFISSQEAVAYRANLLKMFPSKAP